MSDLLTVNNLCKTFKLSLKQQKIEGKKIFKKHLFCHFFFYEFCFVKIPE